MLRCTNCGEATEGASELDRSAEVEAEGSRGVVSLQQACRMCRRVFTVTVGADEAAPAVAVEDDEGEGKVLRIECRGCEPVSTDPAEVHLVATTASGEAMDVSLEDGEWIDVTEEAEEVIITALSLGWGAAAGGGSKGRRRKR